MIDFKREELKIKADRAFRLAWATATEQEREEMKSKYREQFSNYELGIILKECLYRTVIEKRNFKS